MEEGEEKEEEKATIHSQIYTRLLHLKVHSCNDEHFIKTLSQLLSIILLNGINITQRLYKLRYSKNACSNNFLDVTGLKSFQKMIFLKTRSVSNIFGCCSVSLDLPVLLNSPCI